MRRTSEDLIEGERLVRPSVPWPAEWSVEQVIETLEPLTRPERRQRLRHVIAARIGSVTLLMDAPHDPHNAAAVVRTCDAFGIPELHVVPRDERLLLGRHVAKGAERWVDAVLHPTPEAAIHTLSSQGFTIVTCQATGRLEPQELSKFDRVALVLGNEHDGLREELVARADESVRIPMRGFVESLNLSVAAAVLLSHATSRRAGDLDPQSQRLLYAKGLYLSVPRAADVLSSLASARVPSFGK
jgi:tRNA (guanosine-2'-O-)-methyltransferase